VRIFLADKREVVRFADSRERAKNHQSSVLKVRIGQKRYRIGRLPGFAARIELTAPCAASNKTLQE
jgi:hypothetical protein